MSGELERFGGAFGFAGVSTTPTSLTIGTDLSFEEWESLLVGMAMAANALAWWIGDAIAFGEAKFGQTYAQVSATLAQKGVEVAASTLANWNYVSTRVAPSRRRDDLRYSVHVEVARLDPPAQTEMLALAAEKGYGVRDLRAEIEARFGSTSERPSMVELPAAYAARLERVLDAASNICNVALPDRRGYVCVPPDLWRRLVAAVEGEQ